MDDGEYEYQILKFELIQQNLTPFHSRLHYPIQFNLCFDFKNSKGDMYASLQESALVFYSKTLSTYFQTMEAIDQVLTRVPLSVPDYEREQLKEFAWDAACPAIRRIGSLTGGNAVDLDILVQVQDRFVHQIKSANVSCCCICLDDFDFKSSMGLPCSHVFHSDCIREWLRTSPYCPLCRFKMPTTTTATTS